MVIEGVVKVLEFYFRKRNEAKSISLIFARNSFPIRNAKTIHPRESAG